VVRPAKAGHGHNGTLWAISSVHLDVRLVREPGEVDVVDRLAVGILDEEALVGVGEEEVKRSDRV
jgi:hypothetical protein